MKKGTFIKIKLLSDCDGLDIKSESGKYGWSSSIHSLDNDFVLHKEYVLNSLAKIFIQHNLDKDLIKTIKKKKHKKP